MVNIIKEEIRYYPVQSSEVQEKRLEIIDFLLTLSSERMTLFPEREINEDEYPMICEKIADRIHHLVIAIHDENIVGMTTMMKKGNGVFAKISPFINGFIVVKLGFQRMGIGSKLSKIQVDCFRRKWYFWHSTVKIENKAMLSVNKKNGVFVVGKDDRFYHGFLPTRDELKIFSPLVYVLFRIYYVEKYRIKKNIQKVIVAHALHICI